MTKNYNSIYTDKGNKKSDIVDQEMHSETTPELKEKDPIMCKVINCTLLNIRQKPNIKSEVQCVVNEGTALICHTYDEQTLAMLELKKSADPLEYVWIPVATNEGINGYVMSKYVTLVKTSR